jgi:peroxidase
LKQVYDHVDDIDLFAGGFLEQRDLGTNAILGPVFRCIVADGFMGLKYGDRFWYDLGDLPGLPRIKFTLKQLSEIRKSSMARIVCDNTETTTQQPQAFRTSYEENRGDTRCDNYEQIPKLDFSSFSGLED